MEKEYRIEVHNKDSRKCHLEENSVDLCFTSPPYPNLDGTSVEYYGNSPAQLGNQGSLEGFLGGLKEILAECFRVLKPGKFCVWVVQDVRDEGHLYSFHSDCLRLAQEVGFVHHDICFYSVGQLSPIFARRNERAKITGKNHEYILVWKKPGQRSPKGGK